MKTRFITILSALAFLAISCEEDPDKGSVWADPKFVRIVAPTEKVISGNREVELYYKEGQQLKLWETDGSAVNLKINKDKDSVFFSYEWIPDAVPAYAAFPAAEGVTCNAGLFEVEVKTEQKVSTSGAIETFVAVGQVTGANRQSYKVSPISNVTGFVELTFMLPHVESFTLEAPGGEPLAGKVSVDYEKLKKGEEPWFTAVDCSESVTVRPAEEEGTLDAGSYYVAVLPGVYSQGLKVTVNYMNEQSLEKVYGETGLTVSRSAVLDPDVNAVDSGLIEKLPDDIRIDLDFSEGWPFVEEIVSPEQQIAADYAEDRYTYRYEFEYEGSTEEYFVPFMLKANKTHNTPYKYANGTFQPGGAYGSVALPAFPEHYLRAIKLEVNNESSGKTYLLNNYDNGVRLLDWQTPALKNAPSVLSFPTADGITPALATSYKLSYKEGGAVITNISLLYSKELPTEYDDNPFGDEIVEPEPPVEAETLPTEITLTLDFAAGWPFNEPCAAKETQVVTGESYSYTYDYEYGGRQETQTMNFFITKGGMATDYSYEYVDGALFFDSDIAKQNSTAMIALPVVQDRYLSEVRAVHNADPWVNGGKNYYPRFNLQMGFLDAAGTGLDASKGLTYDRRNPGEETVMSLPFTMTDAAATVINSELGQVYAVRMRDNDLKVTKLIIKYSKTKPE